MSNNLYTDNNNHMHQNQSIGLDNTKVPLHSTKKFILLKT